MPSTPRSTFLGRPGALVGMVHVHALPGTPGSSLSPDQLVRRAVADARVYLRTGFDAIIIENMHDRPYVHGPKPPEVVAVMTRVALAIRELDARIPLGIQILSGGNADALAVALATGASFIRCENFAFAHVADEGLLATAEAGPLLRYRRSIGADHVKICCDIKKKHASHALTADLSLADVAHGAEFFSADALIVTGAATGRPTSPADLAEVRAASDLPLLVGSGVTPAQVPDLLTHADALIVGSSVKVGGHWANDPDPARCRALVKARDKASTPRAPLANSGRSASAKARRSL
ncbi:MAG: BtpA/SgcQ family protein [Phycisphaeraceae bacterium]|nr:MAG: BtpA/SgcQ family protein [Phycisphaeraceae bacterium]